MKREDRQRPYGCYSWAGHLLLCGSVNRETSRQTAIPDVVLVVVHNAPLIAYVTSPAKPLRTLRQMN